MLTTTVVHALRSRIWIQDATKSNATTKAWKAFASVRTIPILLATSELKSNVKKRGTAAVGYHAKTYGLPKNARKRLRRANATKKKLQLTVVILARLTRPKNVRLIRYLSVILSFHQMHRGGINQFSTRFTTLAIVNLPDVKLANFKSVQWTAALFCVS